MDDFDDNDATVVVSNKQSDLVDIRTLDNSCLTTLKVVLQAEPSSCSSVAACRQKLLEIITQLQHADSSIILYKFRPTGPEEQDALVVPSSLGHSVSQINKYCHGLRVRDDRGTFCVQVRLRFDSSESQFFAKARSSLQQIRVSIYKPELQDDDTEGVGFCLFLSEYTNLQSLSDVFHAFAGTHDTSVKIGFFIRHIWEGTGKSSQPRGSKGVLAVHAEVTRGQHASGYNQLTAFFASPEFAKWNNPHVKLIPLFQFCKMTGGQPFVNLFAKLVQRQWAYTASMTHHTAFGLQAYHIPFLRPRLFQEMHSSGLRLFFAVNEQPDSSLVVSFPRKYIQAALPQLSIVTQQLPFHLQAKHNCPSVFATPPTTASIRDRPGAFPQGGNQPQGNSSIHSDDDDDCRDDEGEHLVQAHLVEETSVAGVREIDE